VGLYKIEEAAYMLTPSARSPLRNTILTSIWKEKKKKNFQFQIVEIVSMERTVMSWSTRAKVSSYSM
jgi:hypothetical protein